MSASNQTTPTGLSINTPGNWMVLDIDALTDPASVGALIDSRVADIPDLAAVRDDLVMVVTGTIRQAQDSGLAFAAVLADADSNGSPVVASAAVAIVPGTAGPAPASGDDAPAPEETDGDGARREPRDEREVERNEGLVDLPAGQAVRIERVQKRPLEPGGPEVLTYALEYLLPVPGDEATAVIAFATPLMGDRDLLAPMFERIAEGFAFTWGEPGAADGG